jgi:glutathione S-transferase
MDIILHHYEMSPFSELLRLALGHKGLAWKSVIIPNIAPKPDLVPLTGGYRKTPVLQIGADIYCDTAIAIEAIEAAQPAPTFFPAPFGRAASFLSLWASGPMFMPAVGAAMAPAADMLPDEFWSDRKALFGLDKARFVPMGPHLTAQFATSLAKVEASLADGRAFLGGDAAGCADFSVYMNVWFQRRFNPAPSVLDPFPLLKAWAARVEAIGHGTPADISATDALLIAHDAQPVVVAEVFAGPGFALGQRVTVRTEDPGADPVEGTLVRLTHTDIAIYREDPRVGTVCVHFPRLGQIVQPS